MPIGANGTQKNKLYSCSRGRTKDRLQQNQRRAYEVSQFAWHRLCKQFQSIIDNYTYLISPLHYSTSFRIEHTSIHCTNISAAAATNPEFYSYSLSFLSATLRRSISRARYTRTIYSYSEYSVLGHLSGLEYFTLYLIATYFNKQHILRITILRCVLCFVFSVYIVRLLDGWTSLCSK